MANIFKKNSLKEKLENYDIDDLDNKLSLINKWVSAQKDGSLNKKTETQCEQAFNNDFFVNILGYTSFPSKPYTIDPKSDTETSSQKPDATLGYFNDKTNNVIAVVEIKDANTPLDRPQRRTGNLTPIQQAFKYKPQYKNCRFVIATNFIEIRLFQDNELDYEIFKLEELSSSKNNYFELKKFIFLLSSKNFVGDGKRTQTEDLLAEIRIEQKKITEDFYQEYSSLRLDLMRDIWGHNKDHRNISFVADKAQKVLDRIVFISFCEDTGLLPDNILQSVYKHAESNFSTIWDTLKGFFHAIDVGSEKLEIPNGYNGGLFHEDKNLDSLKISDDVCKSLSKIGQYDFENELTVNILGHVFEQSITDLEEIKKKVEPIEGSLQSKRKKDGIFYTPEPIVDYIVQNSLGRYLKENEERIFQEHKLGLAKTDSTYQEREIKALRAYQDFLHSLKIVDPACGSGAFLVKVFDYLLEENRRIGSRLGGLFDQDQIFKEILKNNIFGVDLNEESVRITQLSLWLKTAQKGKKLTYLDNNIRCGNSLIDDSEVVGSKAFNWKTQFKEIFDQGGFDIVLGNPPWVTINRKDISESEYIYLTKNFSVASGYKLNLYPIFVELAYSLCKKDGFMGWIIPNRILDNPSYEAVREKVIKSEIISITNLPSNLFENVVSGNIVLILRNTANKSNRVDIIEPDGQLIISYTASELIKNRNKRINIYLSPTDNEIVRLINQRTRLTLKDLFNVHVGMMIKDKNESLSTYETGLKPIVEGSDLSEYSVQQTSYFDPARVVIFGGTKNTEKHESCPKILVRKTGDYVLASYDDLGIYAEQSVYLLVPKTVNFNVLSVVAYLNSNLCTYYYRKELITNPDSYPYIQHYDLEEIPVPDFSFLEQIGGLSKNLFDIKKQILSVTRKTNQLISSDLNIPMSHIIFKLDWKDYSSQKQFLTVPLSNKQKLLEIHELYAGEYKLLLDELQKANFSLNSLVFEYFGLIGEKCDYINSLSARRKK